MSILLLLLSLTSAAVNYCDSSLGCDINSVINSTYLLLSKTVVTIPNEISVFNKSTGMDIFCSPLWGTSVPSCVTLDGQLCTSNCTLNSNSTLYQCTTSLGVGFCDMSVCSNSSANHLNLAQRSVCSDICQGSICNGGTEYCNATFLQSYYNITNGTFYGPLKYPAAIPYQLSSVACSTNSTCFCRRGTYLTSYIGNSTYSIYAYDFVSSRYCTSSISGTLVSLDCPQTVDSVQIFIGQVLILSRSVSFPFTYSFQDQYVDGAEISVYALSNSVVVFSDFGYVRNGKVCRKESCYICKDFFDQWDCQSTSDQVISVFILFILGSIGFLVLAYLLPPMYGVTCFLCLIFKYIFRFIKRSSKHVYHKAKKAQERMKNSMVDDEEKLSDSKSHKRMSNAERQLLILSVFCLLIPANSQCSDSPTILNSFPVCTYDGSIANCSLSFSIRSVLQFKGATSCYNLVSTNRDTLGTLQLKYVNQYSTSVGKFIYYTSAYTGFIEAHNGCYEDSWCGSRCDNININDISGIGQMTNPNRYCIGETSCLREPSAAQCWSTRDKCYVRRWTLPPTNFSEVYNFDSVSHTFEISSNLTYGNTTTFRLFNISYLSSNSDPVFRYQLEGAYSPSYQVFPPSIGLAKFISFGPPLVGYGPYSPVNSPVLGSLGEIQTTTFSQLACPTDGSSINARKASGLFTWTGRSTGSFAQPALARVLPFPYIAAGQSWRYLPPASISTNPAVFNPLAVSLTTLIPINITKTVTVVCPKASEVNATGYFKSTKGYNVTFTAFSTCSAGDVLVSSPNCIEVPVVLTTTPAKYTISCYTDNETVSDTLTIVSPISNFTLSYTATLKFQSDFVNNSYVNVTYGQKGKSSSLNSKFKSFFLDGVSGFFTGFPNFLNGIINVIMMILYLVIFLWLAKYAASYLLSSKKLPVIKRKSSQLKTPRRP